MLYIYNMFCIYIYIYIIEKKYESNDHDDRVDKYLKDINGIYFVLLPFVMYFCLLAL